MKKSIYIFISLALGLKFWSLSFVVNIVNTDLMLVLTWGWAVLAFVLYRNQPKSYSLYSWRYYKYMYIIYLGVFISMFSAHFFWNQNLLTTFFTQRDLYCFFLIPAFLYVQPSERDVISALKWVSIGTISAWCLSIVAPQMIVSISETLVTSREFSDEGTDIGFYVAGIHFVVFYLYYKIQDYIKDFTWQHFFYATLLIGFVVLYQNRSMLLGIVVVLAYSLYRFQSKHKIALMFLLVSLIIGGVLYSWNIWSALFEQSQSELSSDDYNRWKALYYYLYENSPNLFTYIFGNGFASANSAYGSYTETLHNMGIFASDLGMLGMWSTFGIVPLIGLYYIIIKVFINKRFPLALKFMCFHILLVPTIFHFWRSPGILFFTLVIYLFGYYSENLNNEEFEIGTKSIQSSRIEFDLKS